MRRIRKNIFLLTVYFILILQSSNQDSSQEQTNENSQNEIQSQQQPSSTNIGALKSTKKHSIRRKSKILQQKMSQVSKTKKKYNIEKIQRRSMIKNRQVYYILTRKSRILRFIKNLYKSQNKANQYLAKFIQQILSKLLEQCDQKSFYYDLIQLFFPLLKYYSVQIFFKYPFLLKLFSSLKNNNFLQQLINYQKQLSSLQKTKIFQKQLKQHRMYLLRKLAKFKRQKKHENIKIDTIRQILNFLSISTSQQQKFQGYVYFEFLISLCKKYSSAFLLKNSCLLKPITDFQQASIKSFSLQKFKCEYEKICSKQYIDQKQKLQISLLSHRGQTIKQVLGQNFLEMRKRKFQIFLIEYKTQKSIASKHMVQFIQKTQRQTQKRINESGHFYFNLFYFFISLLKRYKAETFFHYPQILQELYSQNKTNFSQWLHQVQIQIKQNDKNQQIVLQQIQKQVQKHFKSLKMKVTRRNFLQQCKNIQPFTLRNILKSFLKKQLKEKFYLLIYLQFIFELIKKHSASYFLTNPCFLQPLIDFQYNKLIDLTNFKYICHSKYNEQYKKKQIQNPTQQKTQENESIKSRQQLIKKMSFSSKQTKKSKKNKKSQSASTKQHQSKLHQRKARKRKQTSLQRNNSQDQPSLKLRIKTYSKQSVSIIPIVQPKQKNKQTSLQRNSLYRPPLKLRLKIHSKHNVSIISTKQSQQQRNQHQVQLPIKDKKQQSQSQTNPFKVKLQKKMFKRPYKQMEFVSAQFESLPNSNQKPLKYMPHKYLSKNSQTNLPIATKNVAIPYTDHSVQKPKSVQTFFTDQNVVDKSQYQHKETFSFYDQQQQSIGQIYEQYLSDFNMQQKQDFQTDKMPSLSQILDQLLQKNDVSQTLLQNQILQQNKIIQKNSNSSRLYLEREMESQQQNTITFDPTSTKKINRVQQQANTHIEQQQQEQYQEMPIQNQQHQNQTLYQQLLQFMKQQMSFQIDDSLLPP